MGQTDLHHVKILAGDHFLVVGIGRDAVFFGLFLGALRLYVGAGNEKRLFQIYRGFKMHDRDASASDNADS